MRGIKKGFLEDSTAEGLLAGCPVTGIKVVVVDGASHLVDSSEIAFRLCAQGAFKQVMEEAPKCILEPIMNVEINAPAEFQGDILSSIGKRKGVITDQESVSDEV